MSKRRSFSFRSNTAPMGDSQANPNGYVEEEDPGSMTEAGGIRVLGNRIFFYQMVERSAVLELNVALRGLSADLRKAAIDLSNEPAVIHLHIQSEGGDLFAGLAAADAIASCGVPVHTHIDGMAASAATLMSIMGTRRSISPHSFMLVHQLRGDGGGTYEEMRQNLENSSLMMDTMRSLYGSRTKLAGDEQDAMLRRDTWLSAEQALGYGLVDEIA